MNGMPSFCVSGIKLSEHLGNQLKKLDVNFGRDEAEIDIINISCNGNDVNIMFGECKVTLKLKCE